MMRKSTIKKYVGPLLPKTVSSPFPPQGAMAVTSQTPLHGPTRRSCASGTSDGTLLPSHGLNVSARGALLVAVAAAMAAMGRWQRHGRATHDDQAPHIDGVRCWLLPHQEHLVWRWRRSSRCSALTDTEGVFVLFTTNVSGKENRQPQLCTRVPVLAPPVTPPVAVAVVSSRLQRPTTLRLTNGRGCRSAIMWLFPQKSSMSASCCQEMYAHAPAVGSPRPRGD